MYNITRLKMSQPTRVELSRLINEMVCYNISVRMANEDNNGDRAKRAMEWHDDCVTKIETMIGHKVTAKYNVAL